MCRNLNSITGEARWQKTALPPGSDTSIYFRVFEWEDTFSQIWSTVGHRYAEKEPTTFRRKSAAVISYEIWERLVWVWDLFGGFWGVVFCLVFFLLLLFLQLITFQISAEPRTELRYQIYFSKQSTASCSSKKVHFCLFFHSKSFPYMSSFLNNRDNWAWKGFALKCQCCLLPLLFISAFWPEFSDLGLWES